MKPNHHQVIFAASIAQRLNEALSRLPLPFENLLLAWFILSPVASFYFRFPLDKSVITFDRAVAFALLLLLLFKFWQHQTVPDQPSAIFNPPSAIQSAGLRRFSITKFELAWLWLAAVALLNALLQATNVAYAIKIAIDSFWLPLVVFHIAKHHVNLHGREKTLMVLVMGLAFFLFATGGYEYFTGANLFAYKGSSVLRDGELRVNGAFAADSSFAIIALLLTLFLRLMPRLLQIKFDRSGRLIYFAALAAGVAATLLPLFRTVGVTLFLGWLASEYVIHSKRLFKGDDAAQLRAAASPPRHRAAASTNPARRLIMLAAIALLLLFSVAAWMEMRGSYSFISRLASPRNLYGRIATWQTAARIAVTNPVAGVGLTNYSESFDVIFSDWQHQDVDWVGDIRAVETPHSNFLWIAAELGLTGFVPYLLANLYLFLMAWRALRRASTRQQFLASSGFMILLAAYTLPGLTLQSGFYADLNLYFFFLLGLLANLFSERHQ
ncbi:MAG: O-antigen ligase family protein [Acidobacteria bacterium]|nr:O-antigen ligase family protein [Acidobacteriota bacterium]